MEDNIECRIMFMGGAKGKRIVEKTTHKRRRGDRGQRKRGRVNEISFVDDRGSKGRSVESANGKKARRGVGRHMEKTNALRDSVGANGRR